MNSLERLQLYRRQLAAAASFEEYRAAHLAWVDMLVEREIADEAKTAAVSRWVATVSPEIKVETKPLSE